MLDTIGTFEDCQAPARWTKPNPAIKWDSDGPTLCRFAELVWSNPDGSPFVLDTWQRDLIYNILLRHPKDYPDQRLAGRLKYRQVLVSVSRQQGKSIIGAILGLYGLMLHTYSPFVVGVAASREQAGIIYQRTLQAINSHPELKREFERTTETRGISNKDKTKRYEIKAAKGAALQGLPISLCLFDEAHIAKPEMWSAVVLGTTTYPDGIVIGITTAGDDNSTLLKDLYAKGDEAIAGLNERFGFFCWEADSDEITEENIKLASPAIAAGRISIEDALTDIKAMPASEAIRYRLNRFVASSNPWVPIETWANALGGVVERNNSFICIDRTPNWTHASLVAASKQDDIVSSQLIASFNTPTQRSLYQYCKTLYKYAPTFVVDGYSLKPLADDLKADGQKVMVLSGNEVQNACQRTYALLATGNLKHDGSDLLNHQAVRAVRKNRGEGWRVVKGIADIDAVMALIGATYACDIYKPMDIQIF